MSIRKRGGSSQKNLWRQLEEAALDGLHANEGVLTVDRTDRSQRNLLLCLERLTAAGTVARVQVEGNLATYRLLESGDGVAP